MRSVFDSKAFQKFTPRVSGLLDQAFFSGIYFIQTAAYVRHLSTEDFGVFSIFYYTIVLLISVQRAVIVTPMIVSTTADRTGGIRTWKTGAIFLALLMTALLTVGFIYWLARGDAAGHLTLAYCAAGAIPFLAFEFHRRSLFLQRKPVAAAAASAVFFLLQGVGTAAAIYLDASLPVIVAIYVANSLAAALVAGRLATRDLPPAAGKVRDILSDNRGLIAWNLASLAPYMIYNNAMPLIVSAMFGIRDAAIYSATRVLVAPLMMLVSAVDSTDKPRAARALQTDGTRGLFISLRRTGVTLLALAAPYLLVLVLFPHHILTLAVGREYAAHTELIPYWVAIGLLFLLGQPLESGLVVLRRSDLFFWSRSLAAALTLLLLALAGRQNGALAGVSSTSWGWGISSILTIALLIYAAKRRRPSTPSKGG